MKQPISDFINKHQLYFFVCDILSKPWLAESKLEHISQHIQYHPGDTVPQIEECSFIRSSNSKTGLRCSACCGDLEYDSTYCKHCGRKLQSGSPKQRFMKLINEMPPHEGQTMEEALAEWLIKNGATLPKEEK